MQEILAGLTPIIEKLGVIGILLIGLYFLVKELLRVRKELNKTYKQRDAARMAVVRFKTVCSHHIPPIAVDLTDLDDMLKDDET